MNKQNLYYIVIEGTDSCATNEAGIPIIFLPEFVDDYLEKSNSVFAKDKLVKITVEEYERTFTELVEY